MSVIRHQSILRGEEMVEKLRNFGTFEKILVITGIPELRMIEPFLEENFFRVHSACKTSDALEEVMNNDFEAIIFDTSLRDFALTTFYAAVEKFRPHLLSRFIFLIDENTDEWMKEFIERVDGLKVWRPLELRELFQMIEIVLGKNMVEAIGATS